MKPSSIDLRQRVLDAADRGISRRQIVEMFEVSLSRVKRALKLRSQTSQLAPKHIPGRTPTKGAVLATDLPARLAAHHDFTLEQHCKLWASSHGVLVSTASMSRAIARLGWTRKKTDGCRRAQRNRPRGLARPRSLPPSRAPDLS